MRLTGWTGCNWAAPWLDVFAHWLHDFAFAEVKSCGSQGVPHMSLEDEEGEPEVGVSQPDAGGQHSFAVEVGKLLEANF